MTAKVLKTETGYDFSKKNKVSVWVSTYLYIDIPDIYFEEQFNKNHTRATNRWCKNYQLRFFKPELMETNGAQEGFIGIEKAAGECSYSQSFIKPLLNKANNKKIDEVTWIILIYDLEYSVKLTGIEQDEFTQFVGAFTYDERADSVYEI